jgi:hypothetical protein
MLTELPQVADFANRLVGDLGQFIGRIPFGIDEVAHEAVDLGCLETGDADVEVNVRQKDRQLAKLSCKNLSIGTRVRSDLIVSESERALLNSG